MAVCVAGRAYVSCIVLRTETAILPRDPCSMLKWTPNVPRREFAPLLAASYKPRESFSMELQGNKIAF